MCLAVPGQIRSVFDVDGTTMAKVDFGGVAKDVCLAFVPDAVVGQYVIVHVGFAISVIDQDAADRTFDAFEELETLERNAPTEPDDRDR